jgi:hypothetical protein
MVGSEWMAMGMEDGCGLWRRMVERTWYQWAVSESVEEGGVCREWPVAKCELGCVLDGGYEDGCPHLQRGPTQLSN